MRLMYIAILIALLVCTPAAASDYWRIFTAPASNDTVMYDSLVYYLPGVSVTPSDPDDDTFLFVNATSLEFLKGRGTLDMTGATEWLEVDTAATMWDDADLDITTNWAYAGGAVDPDDEEFQIHWTSDYNHTWGGRAYITFDDNTGEITDADIVLNDARYDWTAGSHECGSSQGTDLDVRSIVAHEMGHAIGIAHWIDAPPTHSTDRPTMYGSCASEFEDPDLEQRTLEADDDTAFDFIYGTGGVRDEQGSAKRTGPAASMLPAASTVVAEPNPFNPDVSVRFETETFGRVSVWIYSANGQRVRQIFDSDLPAGHHAVRWDGTNQAGQPVAAGVYIARVEVAETVRQAKMTLLK